MSTLALIIASYACIAVVAYWAGWSIARSRVEDELFVAKLLARADERSRIAAERRG